MTSSLRHDDPSTSALLFARNSLNHFSGFSGSYAARYFIPSSKCGVTFWLIYTLVGEPCATGFSGGKKAGGCDDVRVGGVDVLGGAGACTGAATGAGACDCKVAACAVGGAVACSTGAPGTIWATGAIGASSCTTVPLLCWMCQSCAIERWTQVGAYLCLLLVRHFDVGWLRCCAVRYVVCHTLLQILSAPIRNIEGRREQCAKPKNM